MALNLDRGELADGAEQPLELTVRADRPGGGFLPEGEYIGKVNFFHNAAGGRTMLPFIMRVEPPDAVGDADYVTPLEFGITAAYPNPFNSRLAL